MKKQLWVVVSIYIYIYIYTLIYLYIYVACRSSLVGCRVSVVFRRLSLVGHEHVEVAPQWRQAQVWWKVCWQSVAFQGGKSRQQWHLLTERLNVHAHHIWTDFCSNHGHRQNNTKNMKYGSIKIVITIKTMATSRLLLLQKQVHADAVYLARVGI